MLLRVQQPHDRQIFSSNGTDATKRKASEGRNEITFCRKEQLAYCSIIDLHEARCWSSPVAGGSYPGRGQLAADAAAVKFWRNVGVVD